MALTNWNDILNKPKGIEAAEELELQVQQLSASVLSISEDVGEIALDISQLSASVLSIAGDVEEITEVTTETLTTGIDIVRCGKSRTLILNFFTPTTTAFYTLSPTDCPKKDISAIVRWQSTDNKYYSAMVTIQTNGNVSSSYFTETTAAFISNGTLLGTINYITN